jgi:hypothetical protein
MNPNTKYLSSKRVAQLSAEMERSMASQNASLESLAKSEFFQKHEIPSATLWTELAGDDIFAQDAKLGSLLGSATYNSSSWMNLEGGICQVRLAGEGQSGNKNQDGWDVRACILDFLLRPGVTNLSLDAPIFAERRKLSQLDYAIESLVLVLGGELRIHDEGTLIYHLRHPLDSAPLPINKKYTLTLSPTTKEARILIFAIAQSRRCAAMPE